LSRKVNFSLRALCNRLIDGLVGGLVVGLVYGLVFTLMDGLVFGLISSLVFILSGGLIDKSSIAESSHINQGLRQTIVVGLVLWLMGSGLVIGLGSGLVIGLGVGLVVGLIVGLRDVIYHLLLRYILWRVEKVAPRRFDHFLYHARDLRLMRQVGGGFI